MTTVTVLKFATAAGASEALEVIRRLQKQHLITLHDAAIVSWPADRKAPKTHQLVDLVAAGSIGGLFWGMLFGLVFITPLFGMVVGSAVGAIGGAFRDYGIDDNFIRSIRGAVTPGTSALFLMTSDAVLDRVVKSMQPLSFEIIATNLSGEQERKLRELFAQ